MTLKQITIQNCTLACIALQAGCNPTPVSVRGRIDLDGKPLSEAVILFVPKEAGRKKTGGEIVDGAYELPAVTGLLPGTYRVEIVDNPPLDSPEAHRRAPGTPSKRRRFPAGYSDDSPLAIELVEGGSTEFNFSLKDRTQN
jgi:hypothetical protein